MKRLLGACLMLSLGAIIGSIAEQRGVATAWVTILAVLLLIISSFGLALIYDKEERRRKLSGGAVPPENSIGGRETGNTDEK